MLGQEAVTIGTTSVPCVLNEVTDTKEFGATGNALVKRLSAVCKTSALPDGDLVKLSATARGQVFRVDTVTRGAVFTTLGLETSTRA